MLKLKIFTIIFILILISGCAPLQVHRLPAYDYAMNIDGPERPKLFYADSVKIDSALTPFAVISTFEGGGRDFATRRIWKKAAELKADLVLIKHGQTQYAGSTATAVPLPYGGATAMAVQCIRHRFMVFYSK
ncbi:MAG: hypothetical protein HS130_00460 [Deltaproteobacteria bacterium]|nr:hypothetical protein [Deltaproteobacteria bacterium]